MTRVLLIDNYDSFVYNIARHVKQLGAEYEVVRNDAASIKDIVVFNPSHIILSPGPCAPDEAGLSLALVEDLYRDYPLLGICLGHQVIGQAFGGEIRRAINPMHGMSSPIFHMGEGLFRKVHSPVTVGRYHSLIVDESCLTNDILVTARSQEGEVMAISHKYYPVYGVQFHPESVLTECGYVLLNNFINSNKNIKGNSVEDSIISI